MNLPLLFTLLVIFLIIITVVIIYSFNIVVTPLQITGIVIFFSVALIAGLISLIISLLKQRTSSENLAYRTWSFAKEWWYKTFNENIVKDEMTGGSRYFGSIRYFAFYAHRDANCGSKSGMPVQIVVEIKDNGSFDIAWWDDQPGEEAEHNPFYGFNAGLTGLPNPTVKPSNEPSIISRRPYPTKHIVESRDRRKKDVEEFVSGKIEENDEEE